MSRLVMYWQCKQGWGLWEWDQARYADMVTGCYWENSVSRQPMVPVCSQMIQQISTSSGRLRPSRRHRRSEDGFCRASMKWELVWLVVFSPVSSWFLYVCFLMFFYHGFFICYRLFLNLSNFCAIHSRWWWQISNAVARESLERQCNLCRPGRESVDSQSESLTKKKEHVQHMSNICPTLDIIKCQFDCTRTLCDDSDGSDLSFLVTYCHLLSLDSKNFACEAFAGKHLGTKRFVAKINAERIGTERRTWKHSAWWQRDVWKICSRFWGQAMEQY
jgi:hypothetical protein